MKNAYLLSILVLASIQSLMAQRDCCLHTGLPQPGQNVAVNTGIPGNNVVDDVSCSCLASEGGSFWIGFTCTSSGTLEFNIQPFGTNEYDFAIWEGHCPCGTTVGGLPSNPPPVISCNDVVGTGATGASSDPMGTFGVPNSAQFNPTIFLEAGKSYYFLLSNRTSDLSSFQLFVEGTASWQAIDLSSVNFSGPEKVCAGGNGTFVLDPVPNNDLYKWTVQPVGPEIYTSQSTWTFNFPNPGSFQVCVTLTITPPACQLAQHCKIVEVEEIPNPAGFEFGQVCTNSEYIASNGQAFYYGGVFDLVYTTAQGCDSIIELHLTQVPSDQKYTVETVCQGDCIDFAGSTICDPGFYDEVLQNQYGCDSINTLLLVSVPIETVISGGGAINCNTSSILLTSGASLYGSNPIYTWKKGNTVVGTSPSLTVTSGGVYTLTIKSMVGNHTCTDEVSVTISENTAPPQGVSATGGSLNCNNTQVTLQGNSTTSGATFHWDGPSGFSSNEQNPTVSIAGTYSLTVTGTNGCKAYASAQVSQVPPVSAQISATDDVACNGGSDGSATVSASGGNGTLTFQWSNGQSGVTASGLVAGTYAVTVSDANGCTAVQTVVIAQPLILTVNASATAQTTFGVNDGTATANPVGGTGAYTYLWNTGNTGQSLTGLAPGNYTVTVTDANGCTATQTITVAGVDCAVMANTSKTDVSCAGAANGSATVNLTFATPPLSFLWSNGGTGQTIMGLSGGTYDVTATDANGCAVVATVAIAEPLPITPNATATATTGFSVDDGTATAAPNGGALPYSFLWSNGEVTPSISNLAPGTYTVIITDANNCTAEQEVTVEEFVCAVSASTITSNATCNGASDGQATIVLAGGTAPINYMWSNGGMNQSISDLAAGTYTATATDANGCPATADAIVTEPSALGFEVVALTEAMCGASDGSITVTGIGGTPDYAYQWQSGGDTQTLSGLPAGSYTVEITDANGCSGSFDVDLGTDDDVPPMASAVDISISLDANGTASITPDDLDGGSTDDCVIALLGLDQSDFDCSDIGDNNVTLSVTDSGGNTSTATSTVTVVDDLPPVLVLQDISVTIGPSGTATITPQMLDAGSSDNCGIVEWSLSQATFGCDDGGANTIEVTATDASGNSNTATVVVTVAGGSAGPAIDCPGNILLPSCDPVAEFDVTATDNCGGDVTLVQDSGLPSGSAYPAGTTTVVFTATNTSGGTTTCSFDVTVSPPIAISSAPQDVTCFGEADGSANATATGGTPPLSYLWSNGADTPTATGLAAGEYTVTVTDAGGCTATSAADVGQPADLTTLLVDIVNDTIGQSNGSIEVTVSGGVQPYTFAWKNSTGTVIGTTEDISGLPAGTYTLVVTDANGCLSQSGYTIQEINATTETGLGGHVLLYPNPTSGMVTIELTGLAIQQSLQVTAFDVTGRLVSFERANVNKLTMNFKEKPSGVYLLKIVVGNEMITKRLVVR